MKQPSKKELAQLKRSALKAQDWEEVEGFSASKPTSIRLSPKLIQDLQKIADLRGEQSYQTLLKKWVAERISYEIELVELVRRKKAG